MPCPQRTRRPGKSACVRIPAARTSGDLPLRRCFVTASNDHYPVVVIPFVAPPVWPTPVRQGRLASTIVRNSSELREDREAMAQFKKCRVALLGIPDDTGVELNHGRPGAKHGPHALRAALARYGVASPMDEPETGSAYPRIFDAGDVILGQTIHETHDRVTEATQALLEAGLFPIAIGGGHDLTFPFVRGVSRVFGPLTGVYLDAHLDVRPDVGSGMSFRSLLDGGFARRVTCVGADALSNTREHLAYLHSRGCAVQNFNPASWPGPETGAAGDDRQFVSLDMDVIDMAHAPGVSAMNPCGMTPAQVGAYVDAAGRSPYVKCFDIMELSPPNDEPPGGGAAPISTGAAAAGGGRTARLAAHLLLRFLRGYTERPA